MIDGRSVLAIIPARGGSKGIPQKNIKPLAEKPLLQWTFDAAQKSKYLDRIVLSSDDTATIELAQSLGCEVPFRRPSEISSDTASSADLVLHALREIPESFHYVVLLQPTSPLRTADDIDATLELCHRLNASSATTLAPTLQSPFHMYTKNSASQTYTPVLSNERKATRRQDRPATYVLNGAVFVIETTAFKQKPVFIDELTCFHEMPSERSVDIDTPLDFEYADFLLARSKSIK